MNKVLRDMINEKNMKKLLLVLTMMTCAVLTLGAQAKIYTKKMKVADFTEKTLKVVLSGNEMADAPFKADVVNHWRLSPYEFCSMSEFNALKTDDNYYFMFIVSRADEIDYLEIVKGNPQPGDNLEKMLSVVSLPLRASGDRGVRYLAYLGAYLDFFQDFIADAMTSDIIGYSGLSRQALAVKLPKGSGIRIADADLASGSAAEIPALLADKDVRVVSTEEADNLMMSAADQTLVGYSIRPVRDVKHKYCFTLLIGAGDHKLYYCNKQYYKQDETAGFTAGVIRKILWRLPKQ